MTVRLPSHERYTAAVEKEHRWLPILAPALPMPIPVPLALGSPAEGYLRLISRLRRVTVAAA